MSGPRLERQRGFWCTFYFRRRCDEEDRPWSDQPFQRYPRRSPPSDQIRRQDINQARRSSGFRRRAASERRCPRHADQGFVSFAGEAIMTKLDCNRPIDFDGIDRTALALLPSLLARWLPGGKRRGQEYLAKN